jgi:alkylhydroperoxidase family enzyme
MTASPDALPRIAPLDAPWDPRVEEDLSKLMPKGMEPIALFRTLAKNPRVLRRVRRGGLLDPGSISIRQRELVILRTTARCRAEYEWGVHVAFFATAAGLSSEQVRATVLDDPHAWSREDASLIALADELHERATLSDARFAELRGFFDEAQILELLALAGQYHAISFMVNAAAVSLEPGAPRFPTR